MDEEQFPLKGGVRFADYELLHEIAAVLNLPVAMFHDAVAATGPTKRSGPTAADVDMLEKAFGDGGTELSRRLVATLRVGISDPSE